MELLPPVGWADVATKQDLARLRTELDARFDRVEARFDGLKHEMRATMERALRGQTWKLIAIYVASMGTLIGALIAGAKF